MFLEAAYEIASTRMVGLGQYACKVLSLGRDQPMHLGATSDLPGFDAMNP